MRRLCEHRVITLCSDRLAHTYTHTDTDTDTDTDTQNTDTDTDADTDKIKDAVREDIHTRDSERETL